MADSAHLLLQKKPVVKKAYENKGVVDQGQVLDDPVAEKLRLAK